IAEKLRSKLRSSDRQQVTKQGTQNPEAYEVYLKGRYSWNKRTGPELEKAISYFNQAITKDPGYALAYSGLADAYNVLPNYGGIPSETYPRSNAAARKALELDGSLVISEEQGYDRIMARHYDEAIVICKKVLLENPTFARVHDCLAGAYWGKRGYPQVIEEWRAYGQLSGDRNDSAFASAAEQGFRSAGWKGALTKGIETREAQRKTGYSSAYDIACLYADLGDKDEAFRWLNIAYQERDIGLLRLKTDFRLDSLRSDPRLAVLVR